MKKLSFDYRHASPWLEPRELEQIQPQIEASDRLLRARTGPGREFLGWLDLPETYDREEFRLIQVLAESLQSKAEAVVVVGIGGSYLGARAAIEFLSPAFPGEAAGKTGMPTIYFAGNTLSAHYLSGLCDLIREKSTALVVISKSGTTTEPAIAFRILRRKLEERYGREGARDRIIAITDKQRGALKQLADQEGYASLTVPDDVGGRFSVLSPVGLLPIAAAGFSVEKLLAGAARAQQELQAPFSENEAMQYAACRNLLYQKGYPVELLIGYEPRLLYLAEWWKQLFGESEGKDGKGIFPASASFTTDLHSLGQYIQDGRRLLFETVLHLEDPGIDLPVPEESQDLDGLNYLAGKTLNHVNNKAAAGTLQAHHDGGVPNLRITLPAAGPEELGYLFYFFELSCALSGYTLAVNPFDQPGVEAYKRNMFRLLGKP